MLQIIIKDGTVEPFQQDPEALTTQLALAHLVAHLLGRTPSLQIFQITFSLPAHKCSANRHEAQRKCKAFARPATTDGRETQPKFREPSAGGVEVGNNEWSSQQLNPETQTRQNLCLLQSTSGHTVTPPMRGLRATKATPRKHSPGGDGWVRTGWRNASSSQLSCWLHDETGPGTMHVAS
jgi:hypothetical protein